MSGPRPPSRCWSLALLALAAATGGCGTRDGTPAAGGHATTAETSGNAQPASAPAQAEPASGELLLASAPQGWKETGAMHTPVLRMAEYGPAEETEGRLERLTLEAESTKPLPDPINFVIGLDRGLKSRCEGFQGINISSGEENGYPTSVRLMICPKFKDSPTGQVLMAKAIQGNDRFYVITRRLQTPPMKDDGQPLTAQAMAEWTTHLKRIAVCDTRGDQHPCPQAVTGTALSDGDTPPPTTPE